MCVYDVCEGTHATGTCGDQRATLESVLSFSLYTGSGNQLRSPGMGSKLYLLRHLIGLQLTFVFSVSKI